MKTRCFHFAVLLLICFSIPLTVTAQVVDIPDPKLRAAIEMVLDKQAGDPISVDEMATLKQLTAKNAKVSDLTGLEHATNLSSLDLGFVPRHYWNSNSVSDLSPLVHLTHLTYLNLEQNDITDISALSGLTNLISLNLELNTILDISALSGLTNLTSLELEINRISDISPLSSLINLTSLELGSNWLSDISALSSLTNLISLNLWGNRISDISPLSALTNLTELIFGESSLSDISAVSSLTNLKSLNLSDNRISDISALSGLTNLKSLKLYGNRISDISVVSGLTNLTLLGIGSNRISNISVVSGLTNLTEISLTANSIWDISPLLANTGLGSGDEVYVRENPLSYPSITTHIPTLQARGVKVIFDNRTPDTLVKISDTITVSNNVLVVEVWDRAGKPFAGVPVTFTVTSGGGTLSATNTTTNSNGRAESRLTLGIGDDPNTVLASVEGISEPVTFSSVPEPMVVIPDPNLRARIETRLNKKAGATITPDEMASLTGLSMGNRNIRDLTGLEFAINLTKLVLDDNSLSDISALSGLTNLTGLFLSNNSISDISALSGLTNLRELWLGDNTISDISALAGLTHLTRLHLWDNRISNISALSGLTNLTWLLLSNNSLSDISALSGLTHLRLLSLSDNSLSDISALSGLTNLSSLYLSNNSISDITALSGLTYLKSLYLTGNDLSNVSALVPVLSGLTNLSSLSLSNNSISDISTLSDLTNLKGLFLSDNLILDISALSGLTYLESLNLSNNSISDITALSGLTYLKRLYLSNNSIFDISPLVANTGFGRGDRIDLRENPLSYTSIAVHFLALESRRVKVAVGDVQPNTRELRLSVPAGISLVHVPMKVTSVDEDSQPIESVGDLYDALGGAETVNLLISHDPKTQGWRGYLGDLNRGTSADAILTVDKGIIAVMKNAISIRLSGNSLGTEGISSITLQKGTNLIGVPLRDSRLTRVSDLLNLEGIRGNVPEIIVSDNGAFKRVIQAGDDGDIPLTSGGAFVLSAQEEATVTIAGHGWAIAAPPTVSQERDFPLTGIQTSDTTPVLAVTGPIVFHAGERGEMSHLRSGFGFRVTIKNLSTGRIDMDVVEDERVGYQLTFVDMERGRAAQIGDILEISAQSPNSLISVETLRHTVTAEDVKRSYIQLGVLVAYVIPTETELLPNYPNPFNPETWIPYRLAADADVTVTIYDLGGGVVRRLNVGLMVAAVYERRDKAVYWDGRNEFGERVASGIYFYHLSAGDYSATRKMVISK